RLGSPEEEAKTMENADGLGTAEKPTVTETTNVGSGLQLSKNICIVALGPLLTLF
ncbi:hypothetical protein CSKR_103098, partial [Clonorchis sinensis]